MKTNVNDLAEEQESTLLLKSVTAPDWNAKSTGAAIPQFEHSAYSTPTRLYGATRLEVERDHLNAKKSVETSKKGLKKRKANLAIPLSKHLLPNAMAVKPDEENIMPCEKLKQNWLLRKTFEQYGELKEGLTL